MQSHNQFSINLAQQKARAKRLLKAIKQGDQALLADVNQYQKDGAELTAANVKLADVQFYISRELGLPSWRKLKAHVEELAHHRTAINVNEPALDSDMVTLHVRCGHDIQPRLNQAGFQGEFLPMIDPLCIGPIPANDTNFIAIRANYIVETLFPVMGKEGKVTDVANAEYDSLKTLLNEAFERIVFWVEHDSYDQLMLLRALNLLPHNAATVIEIIEINDFPGAGRFIGMGQLPSEALRSCWKNRKPVNRELLAQSTSAWNALRANTPDVLIRLLHQHSLDCFPNLSNVITRHLQELPNTLTGLSLTQSLGLSVLQQHSTSISFHTWFNDYQTLEPLPFLGDVMFYALMLPLSQLKKPLFIIDEASKPYHSQHFTITSEGIACLSGEFQRLPDYWVGGIFIAQQEYWSWDHQDLSSIQYHGITKQS